MTTLLYNNDSYQSVFSATVVSCDKAENGYRVILNQTAFFPEQGGQYADTGTLSFDGKAITVTDVQIDKGIVLHFTDAPLPVGGEVNGKIDFSKRYDRMQNHSGEHIVSGLIHTLYGYDNVGFHLGDDDMTLDVNGVLTKEQMRSVEAMANEAVWKNIPISVTFPTAEELEALDYRSKLDLTENVRIVTIPGYDICACCAPHVAATGEIGMIKLLDAIHYKGGMRIHVRCGGRALSDYNVKHDNNAAVAVLLHVRQEETAVAVNRLFAQAEAQKAEIHALRKELLLLKAEAVAPTDGNLCIFECNADAMALRAIVNTAVKKCGGLCAAFSGSDEAGYAFVIGSETIPLRSKAKEITAALNGRGGGTDEMISGMVKAAKAEIESYIIKTDFKQQ